MYLTADAVVNAINTLSERVHPFVGITFLACKAHNLSVGREESVRVDSLTRDHLNKYHRLNRKSNFFFQPFKSIRWWVSPKYASSGLQTANTQTFSSVFLHKRKSSKWGFADDYLEQMQKILHENNMPERVPSLPLAVWIFKSIELHSATDPRNLLDLFYKNFRITDVERTELFDDNLSNLPLTGDELFCDEPLAISSVLNSFDPAPDSEAELGRTLTSLKIEYSGLSPKLELEFGERLSLITGDNGLGKSFLLEFAWWAATGTWAHRPALPNILDRSVAPRIEYTLMGRSGRPTTAAFNFDFHRNVWSPVSSASSIEALCIFARADGSFAVYDPVRSQLQHLSDDRVGRLTSDEVWDGKAGIIEGLIRDWVRWQKAEDRLSFDRFCSVLRRLSPQDLGVLTPGQTIRLPGDPRDIPTIKHKYGTVPIIHASSGVQRVLLLTYLIIWAWQEHEIAANQLSREPLRRLVVFVDEIEAHLHPKWQRIVLPALMSVGDLLSSELSIQTVAATHSPMILASLEPFFDLDQDVLYHLFTDQGAVKLESIPFVKYGDASGWLTSPLFGLQHARSREAERVIERAKAVQLEERPSKAVVQELTDDLRRFLSNEDKFWPRWLYFAEKHGVKL